MFVVVHIPPNISQNISINISVGFAGGVGAYITPNISKTTHNICIGFAGVVGIFIQICIYLVLDMFVSETKNEINLTLYCHSNNVQPHCI